MLFTYLYIKQKVHICSYRYIVYFLLPQPFHSFTELSCVHYILCLPNVYLHWESDNITSKCSKGANPLPKGIVSLDEKKGLWPFLLLDFHCCPFHCWFFIVGIFIDDVSFIWYVNLIWFFIHHDNFLILVDDQTNFYKILIHSLVCPSGIIY